jgi:LysM repeat protein
MKKNQFVFVLTASLLIVSGCAAHKKEIQPVVEKKDTVSKMEAVPLKAGGPESPVAVVVPAKLAIKTVYVVRPNDTLEKISKLPEVYGNRQMWPVLFEGNRDRLTHPSKIYPGQKLRIPREVNEIALLKKKAVTNKVRQQADLAYKEAQAAKQRAVSPAAPVSLPQVPLVPDVPQVPEAPSVPVNPIEEALSPQAAPETAPAPSPSAETETGFAAPLDIEVETDAGAQ